MYIGGYRYGVEGAGELPLILWTMATLMLIADNHHSQSVVIAPSYALHCHQLTLGLVKLCQLRELLEAISAQLLISALFHVVTNKVGIDNNSRQLLKYHFVFTI